MSFRKANRFHGVSIDTRTSTSTSRPTRRRSSASRTASIIGEKRSWKITPARGVRPHRLVYQAARAGGQPLEHRKMRRRRGREVEDRVVRPERLVERTEDSDAE